jgi:ADP-dependent phosphofructokinase/glucokinase
MNSNIDRIQYLTKKAQWGVINSYEQDELAHLLGRRPQEFQQPNGLDQLIGIALVAIAAAIIIKLLTDES